MPVFKRSDMTMVSAEGEWNHPCEVRIGDRSIAVSYQGDEGQVLYEGTEVEAGHFRLTSSSVKGRATLHRIGDEDALEGSWVENGVWGMWRIQLDA